jgi:hypothetical protein
VGAAKHLLDLGGLHQRLERVDRTQQVAGDVLALLRPFEEDAEVVELGNERVAQFDFFGEPLATLQRLLRFGLIRPEVRCRDARLDCVQFASGIGGVKDSSAGPWRAAPSLRSV